MKVLKEILWLALLAVLVVVPIRVFVAQPFVVEGLSMFPTFKDGDYLIIDELSYRFDEPLRGDVVVFRYPNSPSVFYIKRVIGLPGETVKIERGQVSIIRADGSTLALEESYVVAEDATYSGVSTLGQGQYFVMGDNRPKSSDSRVWGPLPEENLMGKAFARVLPTAEAAFSPGAFALPQ
jgi:signal peptidase I